MDQRGVLSLVSQEVAQLGGGEHAAVAGIVPEYVVQLGPPHQLPAELLDLDVVQTTVPGAVAPLGTRETSSTLEHTPRNTHTHIRMNVSSNLQEPQIPCELSISFEIQASCANLHKKCVCRRSRYWKLPQEGALNPTIWLQ